MAKKTEQAAEEAANAQPTVNREPMADNPSAAPALDEANSTGDIAPAVEAADALAEGTAARDGEQPAANDNDTLQGIEQARSEVDLVAMRRDAPLHDGGPTEADVHPDEVANYLAGGWEVSPLPTEGRGE